MPEIKVGDLLDARGLTLEVDEGDFVVSAIIVAAVMEAGSTEPTLVIGYTEGMSGIEQTGLLTAGQMIMASGWVNSGRRDEP